MAVGIGPWVVILVLLIGIPVMGPRRTIALARTAGRVSTQLTELLKRLPKALMAVGVGPMIWTFPTPRLRRLLVAL